MQMIINTEKNNLLSFNWIRIYKSNLHDLSHHVVSMWELYLLRRDYAFKSMVKLCCGWISVCK